eukprot:768407-Hanusia_phi.AAC.1
MESDRLSPTSITSLTSSAPPPSRWHRSPFRARQPGHRTGGNWADPGYPPGTVHFDQPALTL